MGLSTHILDLAAGRPAAGVPVTLYRADEILSSDVTNQDGRCADMFGGEDLVAGDYRLVFSVGDYLTLDGSTPFYKEIPVCFTITSLDRHYHVPLLLSPYGYSTYLGS